MTYAVLRSIHNRPARPSRRRFCLIGMAVVALLLAGAGVFGQEVPGTIDAYATGPATGVSFYVSPSGSDANPGTVDLPFKTLAHAQAVVRTVNQNMSSNITIYLENGIYRLPHSLRMTPADSGTNGYEVVWSAAPGQTAIISGSEQISSWRLSDPSKNIWSASVPADIMTRQIYVDGVRASLAAGPLPVKLVKTASGYRASTPAMARWRNPKQIQFAYTGQLGLMIEPICPVASIHGVTVTMAEPCWSNSNRRRSNLVGFGALGIPSFAENAYELLNLPGTFYLDGRAHILYYIPRSGQDMSSADVEVPKLQYLVSGRGTPGHPIHNIAFSDIQFSYATWLQPNTRQGFSEIQSGYTMTGEHGYATQGLCHLQPHGTCPYGDWTKEPANVEFSYDRNLSFVNDRFVQFSGAEPEPLI